MALIAWNCGLNAGRRHLRVHEPGRRGERTGLLRAAQRAGKRPPNMDCEYGLWHQHDGPDHLGVWLNGPNHLDNVQPHAFLSGLDFVRDSGLTAGESRPTAATPVASPYCSCKLNTCSVRAAFGGVRHSGRGPSERRHDHQGAGGDWRGSDLAAVSAPTVHPENMDCPPT